MNGLVTDIELATGGIDPFETYLDSLNSVVSQRRIETERDMEAQIGENYADWAEHFHLLKRQFENVHALFGKIADRVAGWSTQDPNHDRVFPAWGSMGLSGNYTTISLKNDPHHYRYYKCGYYFFTQLVYRENKGTEGNAFKYFDVSYGLYNDSGRGSGSKIVNENLIVSSNVHSPSPSEVKGIGDETILGRKELTKKKGYNLVGLDKCDPKHKKLSLSDKLWASYAMRTMLFRRCSLAFQLRNTNLNAEQRAVVPIHFLHTMDLEEICKQVFMRLNSDEPVDFSEGPLLLAAGAGGE